MKDTVPIEVIQKVKQEFDKLGDSEQWQWLATTNFKPHFVLWLDNDDTHIYFDDDENADYVLRFNNYAGSGLGTLHLLKAIGVRAEYV
jgi:hypothetical protein